MRCISKKDYLEKVEDRIVGYALYVVDNIKKDDYVRLNTGEVVKVIGIRENKVNKKAIYYGMYEHDWFDSSAVENFSDNIIDLVEVGDFVNGHRIFCKIHGEIGEKDIETILTKESYMANCFKVGGEDE